jgi:hypothetical protein
MMPTDDPFDPINWPAPEPVVSYDGSRVYCSTCKKLSEHGDPREAERAYRRHYWLHHAIVEDTQ